MTFPPPVQMISVGATSGGTSGYSFGADDGWKPPLAGNYVVVICACDDGKAKMVVPSGFVSAGSQGANGTPLVGLYAKLADGSETGFVIQWDKGTQWSACVLEFDAQDAEPSPVNNGTGDTDTSTDTLSSTTTNSALGFAVAIFASMEHNGETPSYTNNFIHLCSSLAGGDNDLVLDIATGCDHCEEAGTYETTATWTSTSARASMCQAIDLAFIDGEAKKDYQRSSSYRVTVMNGDPAYIDGPGNGIELVGLNRGQARKYMSQIVGTFRIEVEHE